MRHSPSCSGRPVLFNAFYRITDDMNIIFRPPTLGNIALSYTYNLNILYSPAEIIRFYQQVHDTLIICNIINIIYFVKL
jgi:hypothetical protein